MGQKWNILRKKGAKKGTFCDFGEKNMSPIGLVDCNTGGSDYKVVEKTAYKVQVSTFWADCKVQVFVNF